MFGFGDKDTAEMAKRLFARAKEIDARYLRVPMPDAAKLAEADFEDKDRFISDREITFRYDDMPEFGFTITDVGGSIVSAHASGRYNGFMLQSSAEDHSWFTSVYRPAARPQGPKAQALANYFEKEFEVPNMEKMMAGFRR